MSVAVHSLSARLTDQRVWAGVLQGAKAVIAAVAAWLLADQLLGLPQAFLAPWAALLVVSSTVYRSVAEGGRQLGATVVGVAAAWFFGSVLSIGSEAVTLTVALAAAMLLGSVAWLRPHATTAAATALFVLVLGVSGEENLLATRLLDTAIGVAIGLLVNVLMWPPLAQRRVEEELEKVRHGLGKLLIEVGRGLHGQLSGDEVEGWRERLKDIDADLDRAESWVWHARESAWLNPRPASRALRSVGGWGVLLDRLAQTRSEISSMTHTLYQATTMGQAWHDDFRSTYSALLVEAGEAVCAVDRERLSSIRGDLERVVDEIADDAVTPDLWPVYGSLVVNLRNVLTAMDVAVG